MLSVNDCKIANFVFFYNLCHKINKYFSITLAIFCQKKKQKISVLSVSVSFVILSR